MAAKTCRSCKTNLVYVRENLIGGDTYSMYHCPKCNKMIAIS